MLDLTPIFRRYARWRMQQLARADPVETQRRQLFGLLAAAAGTTFGREHGFSRLKSVEDFQAAVRLRTYEDFWQEYWGSSFPVLDNCSWPGRIPFFALTSGTTTGSTKYIPCTRELNRSNARAGLDLLAFHHHHRPHSRLLGGKSFMLGGSTDLSELAAGVTAGDLSGIAASNLPRWTRPWCFPPLGLALMKNWEKKIAVLAQESLHQNIRMIGGVPSWLNLFFAKMTEITGSSEIRLRKLFPALELLVHGGVSFEPYRMRYDAFLEGSRAELREVYPASEGFIALADRGSGQGLRLVLDHGLFFEFVPVDELKSERPTRHWVATAETEVNYALVISSCAGLWSYILGDTVKFIDRHPPRILVTGRTSYSLSVFGEHLICEEIEDAVSRAAARIDRPVVEFSVGAKIPEDAARPGKHLYVVELSGGQITAEEQATFAAMIDRRLIERNQDYAAHRAEGFGLHPPEVITATEGTFQKWMKRRGKLGGQHKVPRIINDAELFHSLAALTQSSGHPK